MRVISQVNHIVGIDGGPSIFGYVTKPGFEINAHYYLNYKPFLFKTTFGVTPNSNFGTLTQLYFSLGFTSPVKYRFSAHMNYGLGKTFIGKEQFKYFEADGSITTYSYVYTISPGINPFINVGFCFRPFKNQGLRLGIDCALSGLGIENHYLYVSSSTKGASSVPAKYITTKPFNFNLFMSYLLKFK